MTPEENERSGRGFWWGKSLRQICVKSYVCALARKPMTTMLAVFVVLLPGFQWMTSGPHSLPMQGQTGSAVRGVTLRPAQHERLRPFGCRLKLC